jgi:hypothetical protein
VIEIYNEVVGELLSESSSSSVLQKRMKFSWEKQYDLLENIKLVKKKEVWNDLLTLKSAKSCTPHITQQVSSKVKYCQGKLN